MNVGGYELAVSKDGKNVLSNSHTNALIIAMKEFDRYNSFKFDVNNFLFDIGFRPYPYNPIKREIRLLLTYNRRLPNTIFIRDIKQALNRIRSIVSIQVGKLFY